MFPGLNLICNLIKRAFTTKTAQYTKSGATIQVGYFGETSDAELINPYGIVTSPPLYTGGILFNVMAQEENQAFIPTSHKYKPATLLEGEVLIGNFAAQNTIYFQQGGIITINSTQLIINSTNAPVTINNDLETSGYYTSTDPSALPVARLGDDIQVFVPGVGLLTGSITSASSVTKAV